MPDLPPEDTTPDSSSEDTNNAAITLPPSSQDTEGASPIASLLLKLWNIVMFVSTAVLCFFVFVLKDDSVIPFVILGIIGLCIPPIVGMFRSMARSKRMRIELEKRMEEARQERIRQAKQREMERMQRERILAANEAAIQEAIKNTDVAAIKVNNSAE